jgi:hypothetical protein
MSLFCQQRLNLGGVFGFGLRTFEAFVDVADHAFTIDEVAAGHRRWIEELRRFVLSVVNQSEGDFILRGEALKGSRLIIDPDADDHEPPRGILLVQPSHGDKRGLTWRAPRGPEIDEHNFARSLWQRGSRQQAAESRQSRADFRFCGCRSGKAETSDGEEKDFFHGMVVFWRIKSGGLDLEFAELGGDMRAMLILCAGLDTGSAACE